MPPLSHVAVFLFDNLFVIVLSQFLVVFPSSDGFRIIWKDLLFFILEELLFLIDDHVVTCCVIILKENTIVCCLIIKYKEKLSVADFSLSWIGSVYWNYHSCGLNWNEFSKQNFYSVFRNSNFHFSLVRKKNLENLI